MTKKKFGHGGKRPGAGRPPKPKFQPQYNEFMIFRQEEIGGEIHPDQAARVIGVTDNGLEFQVGDSIYVIRRPAPSEVI